MEFPPMNLVTFLSHLLPSFKSNRVTESLANREQEINKHLLPQYSSVIPVFTNKYKFKNPVIAKIDKSITKGLKIKKLRNCNSLMLIHATAEIILKTLPFYKDLAADNFSKVIAKDGLTYSKANILRYVEAVDFFVNYARIYINVLSSAERAAMDSLTTGIEGIAPDDIEYLHTHSMPFLVTCRILNFKPEAAMAAEKATIDAVIPSTREGEKEVITSVGIKATDPLGFAELPFPLSIVLTARLAWANYQHDIYEETKAQSKAIDYRMLLIQEEIDTGGSNPELEKQLLFYESQLLVLRRKNEKYKEDNKYE